MSGNGRGRQRMMAALSKKHQEFVNQFFLCNMNQTEAYLRVYPKSSYEAARANSSRLIANDSISAEIKARIAEKAMSADEVLIRLGEHARGDMGQFLEFKNGIKIPYLDLQGAYDKGLFRLVKKFKYDASGRPEIELYDAQAALVQLGRHHGLFTDKVEHSGEIEVKESPLEKLRSRLDSIATAEAERDDTGRPD